MLIVKQKVVDALHHLLKEGETRFSGRKAIFSKLNENSLKETLYRADFKGRTDDIVDQIASMWNSMLKDWELSFFTLLTTL